MAHGEFLRAVTRDDLLVYHLQHDHTQAEVDEQERAMLDFAVKLNGEPGKFSERDTRALRDTGFDDLAILDIVMVVSLFNFMNSLADGLGVQVDANFLKTKERGDQRAVEAMNAPTTRAG